MGERKSGMGRSDALDARSGVVGRLLDAMGVLGEICGRGEEEFLPKGFGEEGFGLGDW